MNSIFKLLLNTSILLSLLNFTCKSYAQNAYVEEDMSNVFISGGYGSVFGAAMGTALLPFIDGSPLQNLRIITGGASLGFMLGSAYGFYLSANANKGSYFNYNSNEEEDNPLYSMPPSIPTQGNNQPKKEINAKTKKQKMVGALIVGEGSDLGFSFPTFWIQNKKVAFVIANLKF